MSAFQSLAPPRPRGLRASTPKTPEPGAEAENHEASPPRPRLRLRRRNAPQLNAPTQQFLASVAAADVPIPSIEEPCVLDEDMVDVPQLTGLEDVDFANHLVPGRLFSPPKTPAPDAIPLIASKRFPDWTIDSSVSSIDSSPESSRPSTARSTFTSSSYFSQFSLRSDEASPCVSPDAEPADLLSSKLSTEDIEKTIKPHAGPAAKWRKAPWTRPMSQHLWSTYQLYLQDPKVTPFHIGKSGIPPHGVCLRVSREAKRSWKGSRLQQKSDKSGSTTPTSEVPATFVQWPHTCAATRAHLRELCKANAGTAARTRHYSSPTPFGRTTSRFRNRRSTPARSPSIFSGSEMALSLAVSTSDSMQLQGPLAQLARATPNPINSLRPTLAENSSSTVASTESDNRSNRLGSPFTARSYGPSSSNSLAESLRFNGLESRRNRTVGPWRNLGSPVNLTRSQPGTQKRKPRQPVTEARRAKRPSLASDFWTEPTRSTGPAPNAMRTEFSSTTTGRRDNLFVPRTNLQELFEISQPSATQVVSQPTSDTEAAGIETAAATAQERSARLGSPFSASSSSWTFPHRLSDSAVAGFGAVRRPFATIQQPPESSDAPQKQSLASRLAYIDERLKDFRRRSSSRQRSHSPS